MIEGLMNIAESIEQFRQYAQLSRSPATAKAYSNGLDVFKATVMSDGLKLTDPTALLQTQHFISLPAEMLRHGYSRSTINTYLSGVRLYHDWLVINQLITAPDYAQALILKKAMKEAMRKREAKMVRFPKPGQAEQMADTSKVMPYESPIKERNSAIVLLLQSSGCRNAEIIGMKVTDVDLEERSAIVTGKGNKQRRVYFSQAAKEALDEYWRARGFCELNDPVFARHDRGTGKKHQTITTTTVRNVINEICMLAGIPKGKFTPHHFRHAFAITMLRETSNLALIQDLLGHSSANSTRVYAKIYPDELRDAHHEIYK